MRDRGEYCALLLDSVAEPDGTYPDVVFEEAAELPKGSESELVCQGTAGMLEEVPYWVEELPY